VALSPPYRARIATEDASVFDAEEATPRRSYLLAARLFAGGLSGGALILLLVISSFAVGFGALGLLPRTTAPTTIEFGPSEQRTTPVARTGHRPMARQGLTAVRAYGRRSRPAPAAQGSTSEPSTKQTEANAVSAAPSQVAVTTSQPSTASSAQEPAPQADEPFPLPASDVVATLASAVPALPPPPALPAVPAPAAVGTTVTTLVGTP
jgi:predicted lipid-binding transport protein (Tim44 family)